jgi:pilus assembly protein CpaF
MEGEVITMQEIFTFERSGLTEQGKVTGRFRATGIRPKVSDRLAASGIRLPAEMFDHQQVVQ